MIHTPIKHQSQHIITDTAYRRGKKRAMLNPFVCKEALD